MRKGFTIVELMVIVVVIGILGAFSVPTFMVTKERALDKEAKAVILLIQAAEKVYRMEEGNYYPAPFGTVSNNDAAGTNAINNDLRLSLSVSQANSAWNYTIYNDPMPVFKIIRATRNKVDGRNWWISFTGDEPTCVSTESDKCPS